MFSWPWHGLRDELTEQLPLLYPSLMGRNGESFTPKVLVVLHLKVELSIDILMDLHEVSGHLFGGPDLLLALLLHDLTDLLPEDKINQCLEFLSMSSTAQICVTTVTTSSL